MTRFHFFAGLLALAACRDMHGVQADEKPIVLKPTSISPAEPRQFLLKVMVLEVDGAAKDVFESVLSEQSPEVRAMSASLLSKEDTARLHRVVRRMKEAGWLRLAAQPNLVTQENQTARFHMGSVMPEPTPSSGTISYKPIGFQMAATAKMLKGGHLRLRVNLEHATPTNECPHNSDTVDSTVELQQGHSILIGCPLAKATNDSGKLSAWYVLITPQLAQLPRVVTEAPPLPLAPMPYVADLKSLPAKLASTPPPPLLPLSDAAGPVQQAVASEPPQPARPSVQTPCPVATSQAGQDLTNDSSAIRIRVLLAEVKSSAFGGRSGLDQWEAKLKQTMPLTQAMPITGLFSASESERVMRKFEALQKTGDAKWVAKPTLIVRGSEKVSVLVKSQDTVPPSPFGRTDSASEGFAARLDLRCVALADNVFHLEFEPEVTKPNIAISSNSRGAPVVAQTCWRIHTHADVRAGQSLLLVSRMDVGGNEEESVLVFLINPEIAKSTNLAVKTTPPPVPPALGPIQRVGIYEMTPEPARLVPMGQAAPLPTNSPPLQIQMKDSHLQIISPTLQATAKRFTITDAGRVFLEGGARVQFRGDDGNPAEILAERVLFQMKDGNFQLTSIGATNVDQR